MLLPAIAVLIVATVAFAALNRVIGTGQPSASKDLQKRMAARDQRARAQARARR